MSDLVSFLKGLKAQGIPADQARAMATDWRAKQAGGGAPEPMPGVPRSAGPYAGGYEGAETPEPPRRLGQAEAGAQAFMEGVAPGSATNLFSPPYLSGAGGTVPSLSGGPSKAEPLGQLGKDIHPDMAANRAALAQARQEYPGTTMALGALGGLGGLGGLAGGAATGLVKAATPLARIGASALGGAAGGAIEGGARAAADGGDLGDVGKQTGLGFGLGGLGGGLLQGGMELGRKAFRAAGAAASTPIAKYLKHKDAGTLPTTEQLPETGEVAYQKGAQQALGKIRDRQAEVDAIEGPAYQEVEQRIRPLPVRDPGPAVRRLEEVRAGARATAGDVIPGAESVDATAERAIGFVKGKEPKVHSHGHGAAPPEAPGLVDEFGRPFPKAEPQPKMRTAGDFLDAKRIAGDRAQFGVQGADDTALAHREAYKAYNDILHDDSVAPGMAKADERYAHYKQRRARENDILMQREEGGRPVEVPSLNPDEAAVRPLRVADEKAALRNIKRMGDENIPGVEQQRYLDELAQMDPKFAEALNYIEAVKAREGTSFSLDPKLKLNFNQAASNGKLNLALQNSRALTRHGIDAADAAAGSGIAGRAGAVGGRLALPPLGFGLRSLYDQENNQ